MWAWFSSIWQRNSQEFTQTPTVGAALIEINLLELNVADASNRVQCYPSDLETAQLDQFLASAHQLLAEKPPYNAGEVAWEPFGYQARFLNRSFASLREQLNTSASKPLRQNPTPSEGSVDPVA